MNKDSQKLVETVREKSQEGFFKNADSNVYNEGWNKSALGGNTERTELCQTFKDILHLEKKPVAQVLKALNLVAIYSRI